MAREPANQKEVAAAIEAFRRMDEWDIQTFRIPVGYSLSLDEAVPASATARSKVALEEQVGLEKPGRGRLQASAVHLYFDHCCKRHSPTAALAQGFRRPHA